ncbi:MAG: kynureninase [Xanthomonadales bacterium]|nr:kynureninase [Xanthomonadales bacterium]
MESALEQAQRLDREDELQAFRDEFWIPQHDDGSDQLYFCGNSLGLQPKAVESAMVEELAVWRERAVGGHFAGTLPWTKHVDAMREPLAELTGAQPAEVVTMNTLTVNLHLMMVSFYHPQGKRRKILIEKQAFPSDRYAVASQIRFHGLDPDDCLVELAPEAGGRVIGDAQIQDYLRRHGDEVALVLWPGVQYASGQVFDLPAIAGAARDAGAAVGFDLAHSVGNLPLSIHDSGCDFAVWCTYKYLNAGPGAVGGCFVHERHFGRSDLPRFEGWWGNDLQTRFAMGPKFQPAAGASAWELSTPIILAMTPLRLSLDIFRAAGIERLRRKSVMMTGYLADLIEAEVSSTLEVITPRDPDHRGCQLSLRARGGREQGRALFEHLQTQGVVGDWREPDVVRVAPVPLYNRFSECYDFVRHVADWTGAEAAAG